MVNRAKSQWCWMQSQNYIPSNDVICPPFDSFFFLAFSTHTPMHGEWKSFRQNETRQDGTMHEHRRNEPISNLSWHSGVIVVITCATHIFNSASGKLPWHDDNIWHKHIAVEISSEKACHLHFDFRWRRHLLCSCLSLSLSCSLCSRVYANDN